MPLARFACSETLKMAVKRPVALQCSGFSETYFTTYFNCPIHSGHNTIAFVIDSCEQTFTLLRYSFDEIVVFVIRSTEAQSETHCRLTDHLRFSGPEQPVNYNTVPSNE